MERAAVASPDPVQITLGVIPGMHLVTEQDLVTYRLVLVRWEKAGEYKVKPMGHGENTHRNS